jgi:hypothetical protein
MDEILTAPFVMHGARNAMTCGLAHIEEQVKCIERAIMENPGLAFDLAKTLVESVCRAVLTERSIPFQPGDDIPKLFRAVTAHLAFVPTTVSGEHEIRRSLERTVNGLHTVILGICELRNQCGFASHGSGNPRPAMESVQALLAAQAADAIIGFLHRVHRQDRTLPPSPRAEYEKNTGFNDYVDEAHGVIRIFETAFRPSDVLFQMEPVTYRVYLADYEAEASAAFDGPVEVSS